MKNDTLTRAEIVKVIAGQLNVSTDEAERFFETFVDVIIETLASGTEVKLSGFGKFVLLDKNDRPGRNPMTGEPAVVTARRVVSFRLGKRLASRLLDLVAK